MAQIDFFLCNSDRIDFIKQCFSHGYHVVPDINYQTKKYLEASTIEEYEVYCKNVPYLFMISDRFSSYPMEFDSFTKEGEGEIFFLKKRYGGPTIDFYSPIRGEFENKIVGPGFLGIYPFFYSQEDKITSGNEVKDAYKDLMKVIKKMSVRVILENRVYWVGKQTIQKVKDNEFTLQSISRFDILSLFT